MRSPVSIRLQELLDQEDASGQVVVDAEELGKLLDTVDAMESKQIRIKAEMTDLYEQIAKYRKDNHMIELKALRRTVGAMGSMSHQFAWHRGVKAARNGLGEETNPFASDTLDHPGWVGGWSYSRSITKMTDRCNLWSARVKTLESAIEKVLKPHTSSDGESCGGCYRSVKDCQQGCLVRPLRDVMKGKLEPSEDD